jgi:hypothetical protein
MPLRQNEILNLTALDLSATLFAGGELVSFAFPLLEITQLLDAK